MDTQANKTLPPPGAAATNVISPGAAGLKEQTQGNLPPIKENAKDSLYMISKERNIELGQLGSEIALLQWFIDHNLRDIVPLNMEDPHKDLQYAKIKAAHDYFKSTHTLGWIQLYSNWTSFHASRPEQLTRESLQPRRFLHESERAVLATHEKRAYNTLCQIKSKVKDHDRICSKIRRAYRANVDHIISHRDAPYDLAQNIDVYDPSQLPVPGDSELERGGDNTQLVPSMPPEYKEMVTKMSEKLAKAYIDRDNYRNRCEKFENDMANMQTVEIKTTGTRRKQFAPLDVAASPRLPAPLHFQSNSNHSPTKKDAASNDEQDDGDSHRRRSNFSRRHRRGGPSPSPSPSPSGSDNDDEDLHRRRRTPRRRTTDNSTDGTGSSTMDNNRYAHGSQISTLKNYDGKEGAQALIWLRDLESAARKYNWSDSVLVDAATGKLTGPAKLWYDQELNLFTNFDTWDKFSKELLAHYYPAGLAASAASQLEKFKYTEQTSLQNLYNEIRKLCYFEHEKLFATAINERDDSKRQAACQAAENSTWNALKARLPKDMILYALSMKPSNSKELLRYALQYDEETKYKKKNSGTEIVSAVGKSNNNKNLTCHYCNYKGHIQPECRFKACDYGYELSAPRGRGRGRSNSNCYRGRGGATGPNQQNNQQQQQQQQPTDQSTYRYQNNRGGGNFRGRGGYRGQQPRRGYSNAVAHEEYTALEHVQGDDKHSSNNTIPDPYEEPRVSFPDHHQENYSARE